MTTIYTKKPRTGNVRLRAAVLAQQGEFNSQELFDLIEGAEPGIISHYYSTPAIAGFNSLLSKMGKEGLLWNRPKMNGKMRVVWGIGIPKPTQDPAQEPLALIPRDASDLYSQVESLTAQVTATNTKLDDLAALFASLSKALFPEAL